MLKRILEFLGLVSEPGICWSCGDPVPDDGTECAECYDARQY